MRVPGKQSCRASGHSLGAGSRTQGWDQTSRIDRAGPRRARLRYRHAGDKWLQGCGRDPAAPTFPARAEGEGREKGRAVCGYRVRVWSGAAPRLGLCSPPNRPPWAACLDPDHHRVSPPPVRRLIRCALTALGSPWAGRPLAARLSQLQASPWRAKTSRGSVPTRSMPGAGTPCLSLPGSAPGLHGTCPGAEHPARRAPLSRLCCCSCCRSSPRSTFPRFLRPARPLATQTPPPDAAPFPSAPHAAPARRLASAHHGCRDPRLPPRPHPDPRERHRAQLGAQNMNISVLA